MLPFLFAALGFLALAPAAQATFHLIKVREVYAGSSDDSYVELQMYAAGQSFLATHSMTLYNAAGALSHTSTFSSSVAKSENQRTVLIGDSGVQAKFGIQPDLVDSALAVPAMGGAACWNAGGIPADCVAWGNFTGNAALQSATGTSAGSPVSPAGITAGKAIRRTIAPGCPTLLEGSDDSDSATDFSETIPAPRNNASAIVEATCAGAPNTAIDDKPALHSNSDSAEFTYDSPTATSYECRLDAAAFATCPAAGPTEYAGLAEGGHSFEVRGVNASGPDPTPARYTWTVDTVDPATTLDTHPVDPSRGDSASFGFHADESAAFACSLVPVGDPDSFVACEKVGEQTYTNLADGEYTFAVRATDLAGNPGAPVSFTWEVSHLAPDTTPPQTTIVSKPPDPSPSSTVSFGYASNEPGSSFECSLDGAAFAACPVAGISYGSLANGPHAFQVRAVDPGSNEDLTPAGYSFIVAAEPPPPSDPRPAAPAPAGAPPAPAPPQTILGAKPAARTRDRTPIFRFRADAAGASFECAVDRGRFKACRSPFTTRKLTFGPHTVSVRARAGGRADPSPLKFSFRVLWGR
jgi:hypothetical protein